MNSLMIKHDFSECNINCPLINYFNKIYYPKSISIKEFIEIFYVPFEFYSDSLSNVDKLFIGEAGGKEEAKYKRPFYPKAPSGNILRNVIKDLNLKNYAIANIVGCRPVSIINNKYQNRTPFESECNYCITNLKSFTGLLNKNIYIILLGKTAAFSVLKNAKSYIKDCNTIAKLVKLPPLEYGGKIYGCNFHPRYIVSGGGINSKRYQEYLKRMKEIIND